MSSNLVRQPEFATHLVDAGIVRLLAKDLNEWVGFLPNDNHYPLSKDDLFECCGRIIAHLKMFLEGNSDAKVAEAQFYLCGGVDPLVKFIGFELSTLPEGKTRSADDWQQLSDARNSAIMMAVSKLTMPGFKVSIPLAISMCKFKELSLPRGEFAPERLNLAVALSFVLTTENAEMILSRYTSHSDSPEEMATSTFTLTPESPLVLADMYKVSFANLVARSQAIPLLLRLTCNERAQVEPVDYDTRVRASAALDRLLRFCGIITAGDLPMIENLPLVTPPQWRGLLGSTTLSDVVLLCEGRSNGSTRRFDAHRVASISTLRRFSSYVTCYAEK